MPSWSFSTQTTVLSDSEAAKSSGLHPVILVLLIVPRGDDSSEQADMSTFGVATSIKGSKANSIVDLATPLNRFPDQIYESNPNVAWAQVPFFRPKRSMDSLA